MSYPAGFYSFGKNIGIKNDSLDFAVIYSQKPCRSACAFTRNNFPGSPIIVGREHAKSGYLQAIVINSKNSNVATGEKGVQDSRDICQAIGESLEIDPQLVLPSSTGVIGVPLPMEKIIPACKSAKDNLKEGNLSEVAQAIMTTDTKQKETSYTLDFNGKTGMFYGMAKGAGMIEPNMATMLCYILTDFEPESNDLKSILMKALDKSFHCLSIDGDTSTSDTVVVMASGLSGKLPDDLFYKYLLYICQDLAKMVARDGEGASKLIEVHVSKGKSIEQVRKIGKSIINSPLIKTAIYGGDPNWGRLIMAIGKVFDEPIPMETLVLEIGGIEVKYADNEKKAKISNYLKSNELIRIDVLLNTGNEELTFWTCDLTEGYIQENAFYTT
jgi:glutamate N-acetyltransferase/amino-acid N-acetyltransferase